MMPPGFSAGGTLAASVGAGEVGLGALCLLLLNEGLELLNHLIALVHVRRPVRHGRRLGESGFATRWGDASSGLHPDVIQWVNFTQKA
jgi:hypothetical protein